jgi:hypothetical protein
LASDAVVKANPSHFEATKDREKRGAS